MDNSTKEADTPSSSSVGGLSEIPLDDLLAENVVEDNTKVAEEQKKIEAHSLKKLISTMLTIVTLIFGGAGVFYGIEGKNEEEESETGDIITWKYLNFTLTTIGYGDMSPKTSGGRVFMVFYAIISLGVMAAAITSVGQYIVAKTNQQKDDLLKVSKMFSKKLKKLANLGPTVSEKDLKESMKKDLEEVKKKSKEEVDIKWIVRLIGLLTLIAVTILVGAKGFSELENWTYGEAIYYCFVTLLTIGYGDFYPHTDGGKIFFIFYVFIGLGLIAFVVGDVGEKVLSHTQARLQEARLQQTLKNNLAAFSKITKLPKFLGKKEGKEKDKKEKEIEKEKDIEVEKEQRAKELPID